MLCELAPQLLAVTLNPYEPWEMTYTGCCTGLQLSITHESAWTGICISLLFHLAHGPDTCKLTMWLAQTDDEQEPRYLRQ